MLRKALAPLFLTSIFVIAGCSSDEASKDLENVEDVEMNEEGQQPSDSNSTNEEDISKSEGDNSQQDSSDQDSNEDTEKSLNNSESSTDSSQESSSSDSESTTDEQKSTEDTQGSGGSGGSDESEGSQGSETSNSNDSNESSSQQDQYTLKEVNGEAVNVLQGLNAVEIKRENISGATANTKVILKAGGKEIALTYNKKRDSFRNYQIKQVELDKLKEATVIVKG